MALNWTRTLPGPQGSRQVPLRRGARRKVKGSFKIQSMVKDLTSGNVILGALLLLTFAIVAGGCSADPSNGVYSVQVDNETGVDLTISWEDEVGPGPVAETKVVPKNSSLEISMVGELQVDYGPRYTFNPDCGVFSCDIELDSSDLNIR